MGEQAGLTPADGHQLLALAGATISARLLGESFDPEAPSSAALLALGSSFVTLERAGTLRGCIGALDASRPLYLDVVGNARRAMVDPRLPAVSIEEWRELDISVSVLTQMRPIAAANLAELARVLRPGRDGLVLTDGSRRATFLPAVWEKLSSPERFIAALLAKGGWTHVDGPRLEFLRYEATEFHDPAPRAALAAGW
jgi:uncharacterized protein